MIKVVIVDDEQNSRELLTSMLQMYQEEVQLLGSAHDVKSGIQLITEVRPDLVFLDIEMPGGDGFEILNAFDSLFFKVIIVTGYDQYAIRAIKYAALDYLLKPIDLEELEMAIQKLKRQAGKDETENVRFLKSNYEQKKQPNLQQIILPGHKKYIIVPFANIISIEARGNYTVFHLENKETHTVAHSLSYYEELLPTNVFFRIHKSYIVNCTKVEGYDPGRAGKVHLKNGSSLDIAARRKVSFKQILKKLKE
ncbi:MAG: LytTR family DNA-binding domain-containing protein [Bacteroidota bacterium]